MRASVDHPRRLPLGPLGGALGFAVAAYPLLVRPWHLRWGASAAEADSPRPGGDLIAAPTSVATRAITIRAPIARVWPWVVQMGQDRGGLYSCELLENLAGSDIHNAEQIVPEWQTRRAGDAFRLASATRYPEAALVVAAVEPPRLLLLRSPNIGGTVPSPRASFGYACTFVLQPVAGTATRFIARARYQGPRAAVLALEPIQVVMERAMLRGLKRRAERAMTDVLQAPAAPDPEPAPAVAP